MIFFFKCLRKIWTQRSHQGKVSYEGVGVLFLPIRGVKRERVRDTEKKNPLEISVLTPQPGNITRSPQKI